MAVLFSQVAMCGNFLQLSVAIGAAFSVLCFAWCICSIHFAVNCSYGSARFADRSVRHFVTARCCNRFSILSFRQEFLCQSLVLWFSAAAQSVQCSHSQSRVQFAATATGLRVTESDIAAFDVAASGHPASGVSS